MLRKNVHAIALALATIPALTVSAQAAPATLVSLKDATAFAATLRDMGYPIETKTTKSGMPQLITTIGTLQTSIVLLGCTKGKDCSHIFLSSSFEDVADAPDAWITEMNDNFDFLKIGKASDNSLFFSASHFVEGLPRSTMKTVFDAWEADTDSLAEKAREARLVK
jgi:hypothetical protein